MSSTENDDDEGGGQSASASLTAIETLVAQRNELRRQRDFEAADRIRDLLRSLGVRQLDDRNGGFRMADIVHERPIYSAQWHTQTLHVEHIALEAYLAHSINWRLVPRLQTYRALLGKRTWERHAVAERIGRDVATELERGTDTAGAILCIEKPYLLGFMHSYLRGIGGLHVPLVLLAINGGDTPLTVEMQQSLLSLPGLRACYAHNLHTPATCAAASVMHPLPLGALPVGEHTGDAWLREARSRSRPWAERDRRLLIAPMKMNNRQRERYLEVLSRAEYEPLVRFVSDRLPLAAFLTLLAEHQSVLSPPGRGYDCFRTWQALAVGTVPLIYVDEAFDKRLLDAGPVGIPEPASLTPAVLCDLLRGLRAPDHRTAQMNLWQSRWRAHFIESDASHASHLP